MGRVGIASGLGVGWQECGVRCFVRLKPHAVVEWQQDKAGSLHILKLRAVAQLGVRCSFSITTSKQLIHSVEIRVM